MIVPSIKRFPVLNANVSEPSTCESLQLNFTCVYVCDSLFNLTQSSKLRLNCSPSQLQRFGMICTHTQRGENTLQTGLGHAAALGRGGDADVGILERNNGIECEKRAETHLIFVQLLQQHLQRHTHGYTHRNTHSPLHTDTHTPLSASPERISDMVQTAGIWRSGSKVLQREKHNNSSH